MSKLTPFKLYTLTNFPFVADDFDKITNEELFYKVVEKLNEVIDSQNDLTKNMDYVLNYFKNLDVQDEINNKLDEMAESGELDPIFARIVDNRTIPLFNTLDEKIDNNTNILNNKIDNEVDSLDDKIDNNVNELINTINSNFAYSNNQDLVLSQRINAIETIPEGSTSGDVALNDIKIGYDGKVFASPGNAVRGQIEQVFDEEKIISNLTLEQGSFSNGTTDSSSSQRVRSSIITVDTNQLFYIRVATGQKVNIAFLDNSNNFMYETGWQTEFRFYSYFPKVRFLFGNNDNSNITPEQVGYFLYQTKVVNNIRNSIFDNDTNAFTGNLENRIKISDGIKLSLNTGLKDSDDVISTSAQNQANYRYSIPYEVNFKKLKIKPGYGIKVACIYLDENGNAFSKDSGWITSETIIKPNAPKVRFIFANTTNTALNDKNVYDTIINMLENSNENTLDFSQTVFNNGSRESSQIRIASIKPLNFGNHDIVNVRAKSGYFISLIPFYNGSYVASEDTGWCSDISATKKDGYKYYINMRKADNSSLNYHDGILNVTCDYNNLDGVNNNTVDFNYVRGFAHRCRSSLGDPENSLIACQNSFYKGVKIVEIDVRKTSDNVYVLCHDENISQVSNGTGNISEMTYNQLLQYDFSYYNGNKLPDYNNIKICKFEDMLLLCKKLNMKIAVDLVLNNSYNGTFYIREVIDLIKKYKMENNVIYHAQTLNGLRLVLAIDNHATAIYSVAPIPMDITSFIALKNNINKIGFTTQYDRYLPDYADLQDYIDLIENITENDLIAFCYTVNEALINTYPNLIEQLISYGFIGIGSDNIQVEPDSYLIN